MGGQSLGGVDRPADLTEAPGCYLFQGAAGEAIYIGRAVNLARRVASYFAPAPTGRPRLVATARSLQLILTRNLTETLILEHNLIHCWRPRFNRARPEMFEGFWYLRETGGRYPTFERYRPDPRTAVTAAEGARLYGPYLSYDAAETVLAYVTDRYRLRTCRLDGCSRCVRFDLGNCTPVCDAPASEVDAAYFSAFAAAQAFLRDPPGDLADQVQADMHRLAGQRHFEAAARLRDQAVLLKESLLPQAVERLGRGDAVFAYGDGSARVAVVMRGGRVEALSRTVAMAAPRAREPPAAAMASANADAGLAELARINWAYFVEHAT
jgi:excinuclease ABC subunit C